MFSAEELPVYNSRDQHSAEVLESTDSRRAVFVFKAKELPLCNLRDQHSVLEITDSRRAVLGQKYLQNLAGCSDEAYFPGQRYGHVGAKQVRQSCRFSWCECVLIMLALRVG